MSLGRADPRHSAIDAATAADAAAIANVHAAAWQAAFSSFLPADFLAGMSVESLTPLWLSGVADQDASTFVFRDRGEVIGFLQLRPTDREDQGEIRALYVHPSRWRHGVGRELLGFAEATLSARKTRTVWLWTAAQIQQSRDFYEAHGWDFTGEEVLQQLADDVELREAKYTKEL